MAEYRKLWWLLIATLGITLACWAILANEIYRSAPPIPGLVVNEQGEALMTRRVFWRVKAPGNLWEACNSALSGGMVLTRRRTGPQTG